MNVYFWDTLSQKMVVLSSDAYHDRPLRLYVCGPTAYNYIHVGNARTFLFFDVVVRLFRTVGFPVCYVRNITDIDDKIIQAAQELHITPADVARRYTEAFFEDMSALNETLPDFSPKATEHVEEMIHAITHLMNSHHAYRLEDGVYYDVSAFPAYGKLSKKKTEELLAGARVETHVAKRHPADFVLWKSSKPGEPFWEAPFGPGRPGWHMECSVMAHKYANGQLDIHGGGVDLIHPHHENEIAQSEALYPGRPFSRYWLHVAFLNMGKAKMSKSEANFVLLRQLLTWFHPEVVRLFLLSGHYRSPLQFGKAGIVEKHHALWRFYAQLRKLRQDGISASSPSVSIKQNPIMVALAEDFNTPRAIGLVFELLKSATGDVAQKLHLQAAEKLSYISSAASVLGVFGSIPETFQKETEHKMLQHITMSLEEIKMRIEKRKIARSKGDWQTADAIRKELSDASIGIQDLEDGHVSWCISPQFD